MSRRLCVGCDRVRHERFFRAASAEFPTRSGRVYKCRECAPPNPVYRVEASAGPFRKIERIDNNQQD